MFVYTDYRVGLPIAFYLRQWFRPLVVVVVENRQRTSVQATDFPQYQTYNIGLAHHVQNHMMRHPYILYNRNYLPPSSQPPQLGPFFGYFPNLFHAVPTTTNAPTTTTAPASPVASITCEKLSGGHYLKKIILYRIQDLLGLYENRATDFGASRDARDTSLPHYALFLKSLLYILILSRIFAITPLQNSLQNTFVCFLGCTYNAN